MHKFSVVKNEIISPSTILLTLQPNEGQAPLRFKAGQYAAIHFKVFGRPTVVRCFSIASSPDSPGLQFALRVTGLFTYTAAFLSPGTQVGVRGPFGEFTLDRARAGHQLFIAGGIGVTPFVSMLRYATTRQLGYNITLIYSVASGTDAPFAQELIDLARHNPNFNLIMCVTRGGQDQLAGQPIIAHKLDAATLDLLIRDYQGLDYFICGPKPLMRTLQRALTRKGVAEDRVILEDFNHSTSLWRSLADTTILKVYGGTAATLAVALLGIMTLDLAATMAKAEATSQAGGQPILSQSTPIPVPSQTPVLAPQARAASPRRVAVQTVPQRSFATPDPTPVPTVAPAPVRQPAPTYYQPPVSKVS